MELRSEVLVHEVALEALEGEVLEEAVEALVAVAPQEVGSENSSK